MLGPGGDANSLSIQREWQALSWRSSETFRPFYVFRRLDDSFVERLLLIAFDSKKHSAGAKDSVTRIGQIRQFGVPTLARWAQSRSIVWRCPWGRMVCACPRKAKSHTICGKPSTGRQ